MSEQSPKLQTPINSELAELIERAQNKHSDALANTRAYLKKERRLETLLPRHQEQLAALTPEVIAARGYRSVDDPRELSDLGYNASQRLVPGLFIPLHFASHEVGLNDPKASRFQYRPDNPRISEGKTVKYETPFGCKVHLDVPPTVLGMLQDETIPLVITEGTKKADAAASRGLCCISVPGVWTFDVDDWKYIPLKRRQVYICFDSDVMVNPKVRQALSRLNFLMRAKGATVKALYLPCGEENGKVGLDDYFAYGGTVGNLFTLTKRVVSPLQPGGIDETLPIIETQNRQLRDTADETLSAMIDGNEPPSVFVSGGHLTRLRVTESELGEVAKFETLNAGKLSEHISRIANFVSSTGTNGQNIRSVAPPDTVIGHILAHKGWPGIPQVYGIVGSPIFAANGKLCDELGYSENSRLYYHAKDPLELRDTTPTPANIEHAKSVIYDDLFGDFPFADKASRAHALAMLLLPFVRSLIAGSTPLHLFDAPRAGTGKTLLATLIANVFSPSGTSVRVAPPNEDEWRKQMTSFFRDGGSHLMFDNVRELDSAVLQAALTSPDQLWTDRILGSSTEVTYPMRCVWAVTCNNITGTREQLRRCIWIRLDAKTERPESRNEFRHSDIIGWLRENRSSVVSAAITLIRAWIEAEQPRYVGGKSMGSFDAWVRVMGGILETVGEFNLLGNQSQLNEAADTEGSILGAFTNQWWLKFRDRAVKAKDLLEIARQFYEDKLGNGPDQSQAVRLGKHLGTYRDWVIPIGSHRMTIKFILNEKVGNSYQLQIVEDV